VPVPQVALMQVVTEQLGSVDERFPGYRNELMATIAQVVELERERPKAFVQKIGDVIQALGDLLARKTQPT
jgi:hypothetical protein